MQTTPAHPRCAALGPAPADATPADVLARMALDLDAQGHFASGELLLTPTELVQRQANGGHQAWPLDSAQRLQHTDLAGVATLDLLDATGLRQRWRFTLAQNPDALRLVRQFDHAITRLQGGAAPTPEAGQRCPSCQSLLSPDSEECEVCARQPAEVPSTWVLLRLWRFARPYRWQLLAGFLLTLLSTAATLVPPYLTIPLMDDVLIPFQNGQQIDTAYVALLLSGLLGAGLVAWGLGWARTWLLALVSERSPQFLGLDGWRAIDAEERRRGERRGRPRAKLVEVSEMLRVAHSARDTDARRPGATPPPRQRVGTTSPPGRGYPSVTRLRWGLRRRG